MRTRTRSVTALVVAAFGVAGLAACGPDDGTSTSGASGAQSSSSAQSPSPAQSSPTASAPSGDQESSPSSSPTDPSPGEDGVQPCAADQLAASLGQGGGSGAGHLNPVILLTNVGDATCTLTGYPGLSFVGNGDGTQIGAPADRDDTVEASTVTLAPGDVAHSSVDLVNTGNFQGDSCSPTPTDGFRVYPPDSTDALFIETDQYTACANDEQSILTVRPFEAGTGELL